jgi:hypothetical protein
MPSKWCKIKVRNVLICTPYPIKYGTLFAKISKRLIVFKFSQTYIKKFYNSKNSKSALIFSPAYVLTGAMV